MSTESKVTIHFIVLLIFIMIFNVSYDAGINYGLDNNIQRNKKQGVIIDYDYSEINSEIYITLATYSKPHAPLSLTITDTTTFNSEDYMKKMHEGDVMNDLVIVEYEKNPKQRDGHVICITKRSTDVE